MSLQVLRAPAGWVVPRSLGGDPAEGYMDPAERLAATVNAHILLMCMVIGWGEITEANAADWHRRARAYEIAAEGAMTRVNNGKRIEYPLTLAMVRERIGLQVNVFGRNTFKELSDAAWRARLARLLAERVDRETRAQERASADYPTLTPDGWGSVTA